MSSTTILHNALRVHIILLDIDIYFCDSNKNLIILCRRYSWVIYGEEIQLILLDSDIIFEFQILSLTIICGNFSVFVGSNTPITSNLVF